MKRIWPLFLCETKDSVIKIKKGKRWLAINIQAKYYFKCEWKSVSLIRIRNMFGASYWLFVCVFLMDFDYNLQFGGLLSFNCRYYSAYRLLPSFALPLVLFAISTTPLFLAVPFTHNDDDAYFIRARTTRCK